MAHLKKPFSQSPPSLRALAGFFYIEISTLTSKLQVKMKVMPFPFQQVVSQCDPDWAIFESSR